jgi:hypothetical protein
MPDGTIISDDGIIGAIWFLGHNNVRILIADTMYDGKCVSDILNITNKNNDKKNRRSILRNYRNVWIQWLKTEGSKMDSKWTMIIGIGGAVIIGLGWVSLVCPINEVFGVITTIKGGF